MKTRPLRRCWKGTLRYQRVTYDICKGHLDIKGSLMIYVRGHLTYDMQYPYLKLLDLRSMGCNGFTMYMWWLVLTVLPMPHPSHHLSSATFSDDNVLSFVIFKARPGPDGWDQTMGRWILYDNSIEGFYFHSHDPSICLNHLTATKAA